MELDTLDYANQIHAEMKSIRARIKQLKEGLSVINNGCEECKLEFIGNTYWVSLTSEAGRYAMKSDIDRLQLEYDKLSARLKEL